MGAILEYLRNKKLVIDPCFTFLKNYLSEEKITMLKTINEDYIIDEEMFCDFFLSNKYYYDKLSNKSGFIDYFELMTIIYLLKENNIKFKQTIANLFDLYTFDNIDEELISADHFYFFVETFINSLQKLFSNDFYSAENGEFKEKIKKEIDSYYITIFKTRDMKEVKIENMKQILIEDPDLFNLLFYIREKKDKLFNC
jgi:hypothetical protein